MNTCDSVRMAQPSIISTDSFAARVQRSEATRIVLWTIVLGGMLLLTAARRWAGGRVMSDNAMFVPYAGLLAIGIARQCVLLWQLRRANRSNVLLPRWLWPMSGILDLAVAAGVVGIASFLSSRGTFNCTCSPRARRGPRASRSSA